MWWYDRTNSVMRFGKESSCPGIEVNSLFERYLLCESITWWSYWKDSRITQTSSSKTVVHSHSGHEANSWWGQEMWGLVVTGPAECFPRNCLKDPWRMHEAWKQVIKKQCVKGSKQNGCFQSFQRRNLYSRVFWKISVFSWEWHAMNQLCKRLLFGTNNSSIWYVLSWSIFSDFTPQLPQRLCWKSSDLHEKRRWMNKTANTSNPFSKHSIPGQLHGSKSGSLQLHVHDERGDSQMKARSCSSKVNDRTHEKTVKETKREDTSRRRCLVWKHTSSDNNKTSPERNHFCVKSQSLSKPLEKSTETVGWTLKTLTSQNHFTPPLVLLSFFFGSGSLFVLNCVCSPVVSVWASIVVSLEKVFYCCALQCVEDLMKKWFHNSHLTTQFLWRWFQPSIVF